jgi:hypothetical protein
MGRSQSKETIKIDEKHLTFQGLYRDCEWDEKSVRKLILSRKVAPVFEGHETKQSPEEDECPICMLVCGVCKCLILKVL